MKTTPSTQIRDTSVNAEGVEIRPDAILARMEVEIRLAASAGRRAWKSVTAAAAAMPRRSLDAIILTGCGDSYYAAMAFRGLVEAAAGVPVLAMPAMEAVAYPSRLATDRSLLVAISVSGKVERTIDAVRAHRARGGLTAGISAFGDADLGAVVDLAVPTGIRGTPGPVPGTASFLGSLLGIAAIAAELGDRSHRRPFETVDLDAAMDAIDVVVAMDTLAEEEARALKPPFFVLGSGPDLGVAWFGVAKFIEAAATVGVAQDLEEWAHEQYFVTNPGTSVFILASTDLLRDRARRVAASVLKVGARPISIGHRPLVADGQHWRIPHVAEVLQPLVAWVPMAMTALAYARTSDRFPFGIDLRHRMRTVDDDIYVPNPNRA